jgi:hypothetical protein
LPDPQDAGEDMRPAEGQIQPFVQLIGHAPRIYPNRLSG